MKKRELKYRLKMAKWRIQRDATLIKELKRQIKIYRRLYRVGIKTALENVNAKEQL